MDLDHPHLARSPAWDAERVKDRLVEAFIIERRLPGQHFTKIASAWPATPLHTWIDMVHWDDARQRVWERWERAKGAMPEEVSRMEEAQDWLRWLPDDERPYLDAWAKCEAFDIPASKVMRKHGWKKTTFYRKIDNAARRIADRLNAQGVVVRFGI